MTNNSINSAFPLNPISGGTGTNVIPANGQTLIGNGTNYTVASLTPGPGLTITDGPGSITIDAPNFVLLQSVINASGNVVWPVDPSTGYTKFLIQWNSTRPNIAGDFVRLRVSVDGGATYETTNYTSGTTYAPFNGTTFSNTNATDAFVLTGPSQSSSAAQLSQGDVILFNEPGLNAAITGVMTVWIFGGTLSAGVVGGTVDFSDITNVEISCSTGIFNGGQFRLYGLVS